MKSSNTKCDICLKSWEHIHGGPPPQGTPSETDKNHWIRRALVENPHGEGVFETVHHVCANCKRQAARLIEKFVEESRSALKN